MNNKGFTLIELLVAMIIASIVGMAGYVIFSSSNWSYKVQEDVSEAQQNLRVAMDTMAKDIRAAGFGLPDPPSPLDFGGGNIFSAPITVTDNPDNPDAITILGIGYEAGKLQSAGGCTNGSGTNYICMDDAANFFSATSPYPYQSSRRYISLNGTTFIELSSAAGDHSRSDKKMKLSSPTTLDRNYPDNTPVYIIQAVRYFIKTDDAAASPPCTIENPCLRSQDYTELRGGDSQTLAENIEDIQFAYGIDANPRDGKIDDTDDATDGGYTYKDFRFTEAGDAAITDMTSIIAVRANVVASTRNKDSRGAIFKKQCLEDRSSDGTCTGASNGHRRRTLTKIIKLRNPRTGA